MRNALIVFIVIVDTLVFSYGASSVMVAYKPVVDFSADSLRSGFDPQLAPSSLTDLKRGGKENERN